MRDYFLKLKSNLELNPELEKTISARHNAVRDYLKNNNPEVKDTKLIGSLQRRTRIHPGKEGKIDIDILVIMGEFDHWTQVGGITPQLALSKVYNTLSESDRYGKKEPTLDAPTVNLSYEDDIEVQLVPAYIDNIGHDKFGRSTEPKGRGYWVVKNGGWELADYDHEAEFITKSNEACAGHLVPMIKILKSIKRNYFNDFGSFPLEILAAKTIQPNIEYKKITDSDIEYSSLLSDFFTQSRIYLSEELKIPGSKSPAIQVAKSISDRLSNDFKIISDYIKSINTKTVTSEKVEMWRKLIGEHFPTTI